MMFQLYILLCLTFVSSTEYEEHTYSDEESMTTVGEEYVYSVEESMMTEDGEKEEENKRTPKFLSLSKSITVNEGDAIKLPCLVDNLDHLVMLWKHIPKGGHPNILAMNGKLLDKSNTRVTLETETNGNNLAIYLAEVNDEGEYICQVADVNKTKIKYTVQIKVPKLKLSGGSTPREGNVFALNSEKKFGPVCDDDWGDDEARVVCRQLGFFGGSAVSKSFFGSVSNTFAMDGVHCSGSETRLQDCQYNTTEDCWSSEGAGVICLDEIKRTPKFLSVSKSIIVNEGDAIKLPCLVDNLDKLVMLWKHIPKGGHPNILAMNGKLLDKSNTRVALETETNGIKLAIYLAEVKDEGEYICQVVAINTTKIKYTIEIKVTKVKLSGGSTPSEGNVFVLNSAETFGPVCDDDWGDDEARVVCRQLGFFGGSAVSKSYFGNVSSTFGMVGVRCSGGETRLQDCQYNTTEDCWSSEGAGVICHDINEHFSPNSNTGPENEETTDCRHLVDGCGSAPVGSQKPTISSQDGQTNETTTISGQDEQTNETTTISSQGEQHSETITMFNNYEQTHETTTIFNQDEQTNETTTISNQDEQTSETTTISNQDEQTSETTTISNQDEQTSESTTISESDEQTSDCNDNESGCESSSHNPETRSANFNVHLTLGISVFILVLLLSGIAVVLYVRSKNKTEYNVDLFINRRYHV